MSFSVGRVIKMILRTSTSGNCPARNCNIFVTFRSLSKVYLVTKPTGPDNESSQTITWPQIFKTNKKTHRNRELVEKNSLIDRMDQYNVWHKLPLFLHIFPIYWIALCWPLLEIGRYWHESPTDAETFSNRINQTHIEPSMTKQTPSEIQIVMFSFAAMHEQNMKCQFRWQIDR